MKKAWAVSGAERRKEKEESGRVCGEYVCVCGNRELLRPVKNAKSWGRRARATTTNRRITRLPEELGFLKTEKTEERRHKQREEVKKGRTERKIFANRKQNQIRIK